MIEKFALSSGLPPREFPDLDHMSKSMFLVSLMSPKFAMGPSSKLKRTSVSGH